MWTVANIVSVFRIFLSIPMGFLLWYDYNGWAVAMIWLASITDMLDGWLARRMNQVTEYGKIFDPIADKIFIITTVVVLIIQGRFPLWLAGIVIGRDVLIALGGAFFAKRLKNVIPADYIGKITVSILGLTIMFAILNLHSITYYAFYISALALIYSFFHYVIRAIKILQEKNNAIEQ